MIQNDTWTRGENSKLSKMIGRVASSRPTVSSALSTPTIGLFFLQLHFSERYLRVLDRPLTSSFSRCEIRSWQPERRRSHSRNRLRGELIVVFPSSTELPRSKTPSFLSVHSYLSFLSRQSLRPRPPESWVSWVSSLVQSGLLSLSSLPSPPSSTAADRSALSALLQQRRCLRVPFLRILQVHHYERPSSD